MVIAVLGVKLLLHAIVVGKLLLFVFMMDYIDLGEKNALHAYLYEVVL